MHNISRIDLNNSPACPSPVSRSSQQQLYNWGSWATYGET